MDTIQIDGNLASTNSDLKHRWRKLTDDQLDVISDKRHHLARKIQKASEYTKHDSQKQLSDWQTMQEDMNAYDKGMD